MVSRFIIISAAISLLSTVTFAQHQANPLVNDNGDSTQFFREARIAHFRPLIKRNLLGGLLSNGLDHSDHVKQAVTPPANSPTEPMPSDQQLPGQNNHGNFQGIKDNDEQAGDVYDAGDDHPDVPGGHEAKRSVVRRAAKADSEADDEDLPDDEEQEGAEEEDTPNSTHEAKRELTRIAKRNWVDRINMKTQIGVDMLLSKTNAFVDKVGGGSEDDQKSTGPGGLNLPDGHSSDIQHATDAEDHAKSISKAGLAGDIKAIQDNQ